MPTEVADQNFENIPIRGKTSEKGKKPLFIFVGFFAGVLLILLGLAVFLGLNQAGRAPQPPIAPTPTPTPPLEFKEEIISPSFYATDEAILKIEQDLKTIDQQLQETDLKEAGLNPPVLDWEVEFKE